MTAAPVIGAIVDFSPGINILLNPLTLDDPYYGKLDFGQLATSDAYYVDISSQIAKASIRRGRNRILSKFEAGTATVDIYDQNGDWNPENTAGAYYPDLIPLRKIQIFADYNGTRYYLFTGFITNYVTNFNIGTSEVSRVTLRCVDAFRLFHGALVDTIPGTPAGQLSGTRINEILDWIEYPAGLRDIDAGDSTLQADPGTSRTALQALRNVEESELGGFFVDAEGLATFVDRTAITQSLAAPPYDFADDGTGIAFQATAVNLDADILLNDVTVTRLGGTAQNDFDQDSIDTYFLHSQKTEGVLIQTDAEALDMASMILSTRKDVELRIDSIQLNLEDGQDTARCVAGLNIELLDAVTVTKNMPGNTTATQRLLVQGLSHDFTNNKMTTTVYTGESIVTGFILNSTILGIIGTDVLGY
jgi:hypothetical protein